MTAVLREDHKLEMQTLGVTLDPGLRYTSRGQTPITNTLNRQATHEIQSLAEPNVVPFQFAAEREKP